MVGYVGMEQPFAIGEDPAAHGHWCTIPYHTFTDLYHTIPYMTDPLRSVQFRLPEHSFVSFVVGGTPVSQTILPQGDYKGSPTHML